MNCKPENHPSHRAETQRHDKLAIAPEPFVTANEVGEHLKITRRQALEMARKGLLPAHPVSFGRRRNMWRFKLSEVDAAVASGTRKLASAVPQHWKAISNTMLGGSPRSQKEQSNG